ncbi:hypothetical protein ABEG18_13070 [Alsobacter sp. KACC 23698]|uniref:DUF2635 domain-containing protein n=1 Tax=Alsobacter sp. KACC 23698 TaxID=3149229 RepID=A0AAU7JN22_9HYPH
MAQITNNAKGDRVLPNGQTIPAGATVEVKDFDQHSDHPIVAAWVEDEILTVAKPKAEKADKPAAQSKA